MLLEKLILLLGHLKNKITSRRTRFTVGDMVVYKDGTGQPMLIVELNRIKGKQTCLLYCKWYDKSTNEMRHNLIPEEVVQHFDWRVQS